MRTLTEAHATKASQDGQHDYPEDFTVQRQTESPETDEQHKGCLTAHDQELGGDVREEDFHSGYARDEASFQHSFIAFDQHGAGGQGDRKEEDDCQNDTGSGKIGEIWLLIAVDGFLEDDWNAS